MFQFKRGKLFSFCYSYDNNQTKKYPELNEFNKEAYDYLFHRASNSIHPILVSRYNHLLWKSPLGIKNKIYAVKAIDNYINSIHCIIGLLKNDNDPENQFKIETFFENVAGLASEVNESFDEIKQLTKLLLFKVEQMEFYSKHDIIKEMLEHPKIFKKEDLGDTLPVFENAIRETNEKVDDFLLVTRYLHTAVSVAKKIEADVNRWDSEIGFAYIRMAAKKEREEHNWTKLSDYAKAIHYFTIAGNKQEKENAERLYFELKPKVKLNDVRIDYDPQVIMVLQGYADHIEIHSHEILKQEPNIIYSEIAKGSFSPKNTYSKIATSNTENSFLDFAHLIQFDKNKNIKFEPKSDEKNELFDPYWFQIKHSTILYLHHIFIDGIKSGHLTFENLISYFKEKTWLGKPYLKMDLGGKEIEVNWISLLAPSIVEYFVQVQSAVNSTYYKPNFVLCIDSLTMKFEGLFRNFSERVNIPTSVARTTGMQETYIHNILDNPKIKHYFNDEDIQFFRGVRQISLLI